MKSEGRRGEGRSERKEGIWVRDGSWKAKERNRETGEDEGRAEGKGGGEEGGKR